MSYDDRWWRDPAVPDRARRALRTRLARFGARLLGFDADAVILVSLSYLDAHERADIFDPAIASRAEALLDLHGVDPREIESWAPPERRSHEQHAAYGLLAARREDRPYIVRLRRDRRVSGNDPIVRLYCRYADLVLDHNGVVVAGGPVVPGGQVHPDARTAAELVPATLREGASS
jgi:hypothetical protein